MKPHFGNEDLNLTKNMEDVGDVTVEDVTLHHLQRMGRNFLVKISRKKNFKIFNEYSNKEQLMFLST